MLTLALGRHMSDLQAVDQAACCMSGCVPGFWVTKPFSSGFQASCASGSLALKAVRTVAFVCAFNGKLASFPLFLAIMRSLLVFIAASETAVKIRDKEEVLVDILPTSVYA